jgi:hypothetical protein
LVEVPISLVRKVHGVALGLTEDKMAPLLAGGAQSDQRCSGGGRN